MKEERTKSLLILEMTCVVDSPPGSKLAMFATCESLRNRTHSQFYEFQ